MPTNGGSLLRNLEKFFFLQVSVLGWLVKYTTQWNNKPKHHKFSEVPGIQPPDDTDGKESSSLPETVTIDHEKLVEIVPIVRYVLYATRENVLLVHEIFRQVNFHYTSRDHCTHSDHTLSSMEGQNFHFPFFLPIALQVLYATWVNIWSLFCLVAQMIYAIIA